MLISFDLEIWRGNAFVGGVFLGVGHAPIPMERPAEPQFTPIFGEGNPTYAHTV